MKEREYIVGIDIGGTNFRIGAVAKDGTSRFFRKVPVGHVFYSDDVLKDLAQYLLCDYFVVLREADIKPSAVSIGFPATLDRERKIVLQAPNIPFMENIPVVDVLSKELGIPVIIDRDVCMALYYDRIKYRIPECDVLVGCYFGTGIGNAVQIFGRVLAGRNGAAGELGHIPVDGNKEICGCGNTGCMESLAGGKYLDYLCKNIYKETDISDIFVKHGHEPLLLQFIDRMAATVATEINILDPDYLFIGGGVVNMKGFPKNRLSERIHVHTRKPYPARSLEQTLVFTEDEEDKCVIGAAFFAGQRFRENEVDWKIYGGKNED